MAASARNGQLYLTVGGDVDPLRQSMRAAKSILADAGSAAAVTVDAIDAELKKIAFPDLSQSAASATRAIQRTLSGIQESMRAAMSMDNGSAMTLLNANASRAAADAAEKQAIELRLVADAAQRATAAQAEENSVLANAAVGFAVSARAAEQNAAALRAQAIALGAIESELPAAARSTEQLAVAHNRMGASGMIAEHVVRSFTDSVAAGQSPVRALSMEMGRIGEAVSLFAMQSNATEGKLASFASFMSGPWGLAVVAGTAILGPMIAALFEEGNAADDAFEKLKKEAAQTDATREAKARFKMTSEGVVEAIHAEAAALEKANNAWKSAAQIADEEAQREAAREVGIRRTTAAKLEQAIVLERLAATQSQGPGQRGELGTLALDTASRRAAGLQDELAKNQAALNDALKVAVGARANLDVERGEKAADPVNAIKAKYDALIRQAKDRAVAEHKVGDALTAQVTALTKQKELEVKAAQDAKKTAPTGTPQGSLLATAEQYRGAREGSTSLRDLFSRAGISIDPKITAWCAAFVNAVLATDGLKGTGSLSAKSFLDYGKKTDAPQKGDIVVVGRQGGGHVGFFEGFDKSGNVKILGGNTADQVGIETVARSKVLGYRRAPVSVQDESDAAEKAAQKAADRKKAADDKLAAAEDALLKSQAALLIASDEKLAVTIASLETERKKRDTDILAEVASGKLMKAEGDLLLTKSADLEQNQIILATRKAQSKAIKDQLEIERAEAIDRVAMLNLQGDLATTLKERKRLALEILAIEYQQKRDELTGRIADPLASEADKTRATADRAALDKRYPLEQQAAAQRNADPMEQYRLDLHRNVDDMNEALKGVQADGIKNLEDGLAGIVSGTESVGSAFKKMADSIIADLIRIGVQKLILSIFGGGGGGGIPGFGTVSFATGRVPGYAGGMISGPGTGTSDSIFALLGGSPIRVSNGESIMTEAATKKYGPMLKAMNDNSLPGFAMGRIPESQIFYPKLPDANDMRSSQAIMAPVSIHIDATGADPAGLARVEQEMAQLRAELPGKIVSTVREAGGRGMLR